MKADEQAFIMFNAKPSHIAGMTLRQYAAIHLRVPDSGNPAIDAMIRHARRDEFAARAMQGLLSCPTDYPRIDKMAVQFADALIAHLDAAAERNQ